MATVAGRRRWLYVEVPVAGGQCKTAFCPQRVERRSYKLRLFTVVSLLFVYKHVSQIETGEIVSSLGNTDSVSIVETSSWP